MPSDPIELSIRLRPPQAVEATTLRRWSPSGRPRGAVLLAPGAGSDRTERVLTRVAEGVVEHGWAVATFDFAYRAARRRPPDRAPRLLSAFADVLRAFASDVGTRRVVVGGRSLGGRIASMVAAQPPMSTVDVAGVVALGYPLQPAGHAVPDPRRTAHWSTISAPVLFVHGDRDRLCPATDLDVARRGRLSARSHAHVVAGADHGFAVRMRDRRTRDEVEDEVIAVITAWLDELASG